MDSLRSVSTLGGRLATARLSLVHLVPSRRERFALERQNCMPTALIFRNATLIDGTGRPARPTSVVVRDAEIVAVGSEVDAVLPAGIEVSEVDCDGFTLIPGLIDAHSHLSYFPHAKGPMGLNYSVSLEENTVRAVINAAIYLRHGFTTILDVGTRGRIASVLRDIISEGLVPGPRVIASGQVLSTTGGLMNSYPDWVKVSHGNGAAVDSKDSIRHEVRRQSLSGVDNIKLGITGQLGTRAREWLLLSTDEVAIAVDEARRRDLTVAAHAYGRAAVEAAIKGGVDTVHHAFAGLTDATLDLLADSSAYLVPTAMVFVDKTPPPTWSKSTADYFNQHIDKYMDALRKVADSELRDRVIVGSDSGISNPTATTAREIVLLERLGFSVEDAIRAATLSAARALRIDKEVGSLEVGKTADLCLVKGDLTTNLDALLQPENFHLVLKSGKVVAREGILA